MLSSNYLYTDAFLETAKKKYDAVIFEQDIEKETHSLQAILLHHLRTAKSVLLVLSTSSVDSIFALAEGFVTPLTIINPSAGLLGFGNKGFWDKNDISKALAFGYMIYEPMYQEALLDFLNTKGKYYIRISEHTPRKEMLPQLHYTQGNNDLLVSFQEHGFAGSNGTIVALGIQSVDILHAGVTLQEQGHSMDIFASHTTQLPISKELTESIQRTEKLIIVMDQHAGSLYESTIKAQLWEAGLLETEIVFITPDYEKATTVVPEYLYEQAKFDGASLAEKIILNSGSHLLK